MVSKALGLLKWSVVIALVGGITLLAVRAFDAQRGPDLELWHTFVPHELSAAELDKADWKQFLAAEAQAFAEVRSEVTDKLGPEARIESNRYDANSPIYPGKFATDWNRSYVMQPEGKPVGAVVLLHGLTDSPYSLRHIARRYQEAGFVAVAARMPGHGTVPGGLTTVEWEQWTAATRLSVREAQRLVGPGAPLHVIGFSNGGALAMKYALEALGDKSLARPDRIVLIAPMIGITAMARFAGVMGWPALLPRFAKAAWLGLVPEFNPFKYNSFPVNGARQSSLVANRLQQEINAAVADGKMAQIAPVQTFQSVVDFTVSTRAIVDALYVNLPANGSELVLFDVNRNTKIGALMRANTDTVVTRLLPAAPRKFRATIITNESPRHAEVVERVTEAGATTEQVRPLGLLYPRQVFSLSHLALTFPMNDSLYGLQPDEPEEYGVNLGSMATRGERGTLIVSLDSLSRMSANPFFPYLIERIAEGFKGKGEGKAEGK
ncbi:alpha/beta hydrolase [Roseateles albus]|uniref:alpha/beta hydrolase n=1 Tax=Roseateles albus TaxID=2987525 RepID=UPI002358FC9D|nr:alpha/beta hydrolase [Roseateles albus]